MLTAQDIFDRVYNHFIVNRQPRSVRDSATSTFCLYRGDNGERCAGGLFIVDDLYNEEIEGERIGELTSYLEPGCSAHIALLTELQRVHDNYSVYQDMKNRLILIAEDFSLAVPKDPS